MDYCRKKRGIGSPGITYDADFAADPVITGRVFQRAAELADLRDSNLITSKGESATQTVHHLHVHLVPRVPRDGLPLPWTPDLRFAGLHSDIEATRGSLVRLLEGDPEYARIIELDGRVDAPLNRMARCAVARFNPIAD